MLIVFAVAFVLVWLSPHREVGNFLMRRRMSRRDEEILLMEDSEDLGMIINVWFKPIKGEWLTVAA